MQLPKKANIVEVCLRDGFQSIKEWIPTELKKKVIDKLIKANYSTCAFSCH